VIGVEKSSTQLDREAVREGNSTDKPGPERHAMTSLSDFDPAGPQGDRFFDLYWAGSEDLISDEHFDPDNVTVPVCPGPQYLSAFAVVHPAHLGNVSLPKPNMRVRVGGETCDLWFIPTIDGHASDSSKARNLRLMVCQSFATNLKGRPSNSYPNPFHFSNVEFHDEVRTLTAMRTAITENKMWNGTTLHAELLSRGGSSTSPAKAHAAKQNAKKATLASMETRAREDRQILDAVSRGVTVEAIAERLGRSHGAVQNAITRAQVRRT
jgi:hypothetical protein